MSEERIVVVSLEEGGTACPTQWEGTTDDGKEVYIRYRHGRLRVECDRQWIYSEVVGEVFDGAMKTEEMQAHTASVIDWSKAVVVRHEMEPWYPFEGVG